MAGAAALIATFLLVYYSTFQKLIQYWAANDMYSYGFLVPLISGYLVWLRRDVLRDTPIAPSFGLGSAVLFGSLLMLVVGHASDTNLIQEVSLPLTVYGIVLLVLGRRMTQSLTFPLLYLLTMIPFWDFLTGRLQLPFQLYSATIGVAALRAFDIPVFREGVFIQLPNITLEVADVCSGVNNLVAVLCIGVPLTHFYIKGWPKRTVIITAAVVIALLSNGVRVALVSLFAYYGIRGADGDIHGPFSLLRSLVISGVGFLVLFWLISKFADRHAISRRASGPPSPPPASARSLLVGVAGALAVAMMIGSVAFERLHAVTPVALKEDLVRFPRTIGRWQLAGARSFPLAFEQAGFDQRLSRSYVTADGQELELLLGYFERQQEGRELVGFELSQLIPGEEVPLTASLDTQVRVKDYVTTVGTETYHVTYWYFVSGRLASERYEAKWWTTWNALARSRSDGALVMVRTKLMRQEPIDASRAKVRDFVAGVIAAAGIHFSA